MKKVLVIYMLILKIVSLRAFAVFNFSLGISLVSFPTYCRSEAIQATLSLATLSLTLHTPFSCFTLFLLAFVLLICGLPLPLEHKLHEGSNFWLLCSLLYLWHSEQCLVQSRNVLNVCWMNGQKVNTTANKPLHIFIKNYQYSAKITSVI